MKEATNKMRVLLIAPLMVFALVVTGCGSKSSTTSAASSLGNAATSAGASVTGGDNSSDSSTGTSTETGAASSSDCPTSNTKHFAKSKFVLHMGLAAGTFHRWIYKPFQKGTFKKGAHGRTMAIVKAGTVALFDAHELKKAAEDVKANPSLCKVMYKPITALSNSMGGLKGAIAGGNLGQLTAVNGAFAGLSGLASKMGAPIKEQTDMSLDK